MEHLASGTMTGLALQFMREETFSLARGAWPTCMQVPRVAMVVTDGRPQDSVEEEVARSRQDGIEVFVVGVGRVDMATLRAIANEPYTEHVHLVDDFSQIETLVSVFHSKLCAESNPCASGKHDCEHESVNTNDSFMCCCRKGFALTSDGKTCGIILYAVGVGETAEEELKFIASEPQQKHAYYAEDFGKMEQIADKLKTQIHSCEDQLSVSHQCKCEKMMLFPYKTTEGFHKSISFIPQTQAYSYSIP